MTATREGMVALAARCERASGPDRALDADIALTQGWTAHPGDNWIGPCGQISVPAYTADTEAAYTLAPDRPGIGITISRGPWNSGSARIWEIGDDGAILWEITTSAATTTLALVAASLRARTAQPGEIFNPHGDPSVPNKPLGEIL